MVCLSKWLISCLLETPATRVYSAAAALCRAARTGALSDHEALKPPCINPECGRQTKLHVPFLSLRTMVCVR